MKIEEAVLSALVEVERLGRHYSDSEGVMVLEIRTGRLQTILRNVISDAYLKGVQDSND